MFWGMGFIMAGIVGLVFIVMFENITLNNELLSGSIINPEEEEIIGGEIGEVETPETNPQPGEKTFDIEIRSRSIVNPSYNLEWSRFNIKIEQNM